MGIIGIIESLSYDGRSCAGADSARADQIHRRRERRSRGKFVGRFRGTYRRTVSEEDEAARDEDRASALLRLSLHYFSTLTVPFL